jgi:hypothetical protein
MNLSLGKLPGTRSWCSRHIALACVGALEFPHRSGPDEMDGRRAQLSPFRRRSRAARIARRLPDFRREVGSLEGRLTC